MKLDAKALSKMIRTIVQEETRKIIPELVQKHLSEAYIQKLVSESSNVQKRQGNLASVLSSEEDESPPPVKDNKDMGIYNGVSKKNENDEKNERVKKLKSEFSGLGNIFEGVKLPGNDESETPDVPIENMNFSNMSSILEKMNAIPRESETPAISVDERKLKLLEQRRKMLEYTTE